MLAAGLPCGLPDCQVLFNLRTPAPGPRAPWPRLGRRAAGGRAASDLPGCLRLRSCGIQGGSRRGLELVRLVVRRVLALPKNKGVSTRTAPPPGGTEKGSACRSSFPYFGIWGRNGAFRAGSVPGPTRDLIPQKFGLPPIRWLDSNQGL